MTGRFDLVAIEGGLGRGDGQPAHDTNAEIAILSALVASIVTPADVRGVLRSEHFSAPAHRYVYEAILALADRGQSHDVVSVSVELTRRGRFHDVGGMTWLTKLADLVPYIDRVDGLVTQLVELHAVRCAEHILTSRLALTRRPMLDVGTFLDGTVAALAEVNEARRINRPTTDLRSGYIADFRALQVRAQAGHAYLCPTGVYGLDVVNEGGLEPQTMMVIGARPSTGKTSLGLVMAEACASTPPEQGGGAALFVSVELPGPQVRQRLVSHRTGLSKRQVQGGQYPAEVERAVVGLCSLPLAIDDKSKTIGAIVASVRQHARDFEAQGLPLRLVVIDYLQLVAADPLPPGVRRGASNREQEVAEISKRLMALRDELQGTTLVVLAQLNRASETGKDPRPRFKDLRESGQIEMDADAVGFLWRPEARDRGRVTLGFEKNRGLPCDQDIRLNVNASTGLLTEETTHG